ncbi:2-oxoisovalerate dehydrogenase subunit alpha, mitochondrial-like [Prorops nasuta]|uniref:2-oxoisovalerate dehydrogenase subunit alpha, mitochondrial-like n=1 Tax=Prorops nasuta TaxID=863751 RepID=UPI0034CFEF50
MNNRRKEYSCFIPFHPSVVLLILFEIAELYFVIMFARILLTKIYFKLLPAQISVKRNLTNIHEPQFMGIKNTFTNKLKFTNEKNYEPIPIYRILDVNGQVQAFPDKELDNGILLKMYKNMVTVSLMDKILYEAQRQGRISFYMQNVGEEALQIGSAASLMMEDIIYAQYREVGVLLWRGQDLIKFMDQCYGNCDDIAKGRQMPVHYGSRKLNFVTISSPLTTQLPQAVGSALAFKKGKTDNCAICYFGDGAASEGDAHAAFNFASTLQCPIIFLCRNNGYAVSTPTYEQYRGDGIAAKGPAYGIDTIRVDGNDVLAMYYATKNARDYCIKQNKPVLIEAMTYRSGPHSTSDDGMSYRSIEEIALWKNCKPILRFRKYLEDCGIWDEHQDKTLISFTKKNILSLLTTAEKKLKPHWKETFSDVYHEMPKHIRKQMIFMEKHIQTCQRYYPLEQHNSV